MRSSAGRFDRRGLLAGLGSALLAVPAGAEGFCPDSETIAPASRRATPLGSVNGRVQWGVAVQSPGLYDARLVDVIAQERPTFLAIGSGLKFDHLFAKQPSAASDLARVAQWGEADDVVALARRLGVPVRGDCLAWNDWQPEWLKQLAASGETARVRAFFRGHFEAVFTHFGRDRSQPPALVSCGLVNEPFEPWHARSGVPAWRPGAWLTAFGTEPDGVPSYIHEAFALAERAADPRTKLFLNEANCENDRFGPMLRPAMLSLVDSLQRKGRRIDAVGLECHLVPQWMHDPSKPDWRRFVAFCDDLGRRGVDVYLTELDVNDCSTRAGRDRDRLVAETMRTFVSAALESPAVRAVTNWDLADGYSWLRENAVHGGLGKWADCVRDPPCPRPTPYDAALQPKAARDALADALGTRR